MSEFESRFDPATSADSSAAATDAADASQLRTLSILYYVLAGLNAFMLLSFVGVFAIIVALAPAGPATSETSSGDSTMASGIAFGLILASFVFSLACAGLQFMTARRLRERRSPRFCQIVAGLSCLSVPLGTLLGVFTFIVLARPSVQAQFAARD
ncbi:hypothetical protein [Lysobacter sp. ESA13C]|uniref:hypothetical protein n=1 Tax=unclassified Lysobacter TaxID=2635362 RepID=UPI001CBDE93C|nr:hypothetical protein [Lysobacter sp. ESA13C]